MESRPDRKPVFLIPVVILIVAALAGWAWLKQRDLAAPATIPAATTAAGATAIPTNNAAPALGQPAQNRGLNSADARRLMSQRPQTVADRDKALAERDRQLAEFERSHKAEPVDAAWAAQANADLDAIVVSEAIVASGIKPSDYDADCRSATCRISADFKSRGDAEDWGTFFLASSGKTIRQAKMTIIQKPDGASEARIYGARR